LRLPVAVLFDYAVGRFSQWQGTMNRVQRAGRPRHGEERAVYQALLDAAKACLDDKGYHRITIREIAQRAGTNAAMISYYFGSKGGLFVDLIETMFDELHVKLSSLDRATLRCHPHPNRLFVARLDAVYRQWASVIRLFSSEVVVYNTSLREAFKKRVATVVYGDVIAFLRIMVEEGIYRRDVDVRWIALLLSGLVTNPFHFTPFLAAATNHEIRVVDPAQWERALVEMLDDLLSSRGEDATRG
jgi:AcrR family transcriptional regulator